MSRAFIIISALMVVCARPEASSADAPEAGYRLPKGTKAFSFKLHKDREAPRNAITGTPVDIVGEISDPIQTGIAILNVKLLGKDPKYAGEEQVVTVELTAAQHEILALMQKHGIKLSMRLHEEEKRKKRPCGW